MAMLTSVQKSPGEGRKNCHEQPSLLQRLRLLSLDRIVHKETSIMVNKSLNGITPNSLCHNVHNRVL